MNRYFLLAAAVSIAVAGPLPDLQWQDNNDGLVAFVPESPSTLYQDALGLNPPVQDTKWITAEQPSSENRGGKGNNDGIDPSRSSTAKDDNDEDGDEARPSMIPDFLTMKYPRRLRSLSSLAPHRIPG